MIKYKQSRWQRFKLWFHNTFHKCYMCGHPFFVHEIGSWYMWCRMCECSEQEEYIGYPY